MAIAHIEAVDQAQWADQNNAMLQNLVGDFNGLSQNSSGYRYTIPQ
jgi:hypothetical protein